MLLRGSRWAGASGGIRTLTGRPLRGGWSHRPSPPEGFRPAVRFKGTAPPAPPRDTFLSRIVARSPPALSAYFRLIRVDKPTGTFLLFLPCAWGASLGSAAAAATTPAMGVAAVMAAVPPPGLIGLFLVGSFVMRSAGCIINDMWDAHFDRGVERTRGRPIACGEVTQQQAFVYLTGHLVAGLAVCLSLNDAALGTAVPSVLLLALYPLAKRLTHLPQLVLGLAFNWGVLVGYAAVTGGLTAPALAVYMAGVCWTLLYDTLYAHQDKEDDARLGIKSATFFFGDLKAPYYALAIATSLLLAVGGVLVGYPWPYYVALLQGAGYLLSIVSRTDLKDPPSCARAFALNRYFGLWVVLSIIIGNLCLAILR